MVIQLYMRNNRNSLWNCYSLFIILPEYIFLACNDFTLKTVIIIKLSNCRIFCMNSIIWRKTIDNGAFAIIQNIPTKLDFYIFIYTKVSHQKSIFYVEEKMLTENYFQVHKIYPWRPISGPSVDYSFILNLTKIQQLRCNGA